MSDKTVSRIVLFVGMAILTVFLGFIIFGDRSDCGIDKTTLACRWTGSIADILGTIIFIASALWMFGAARLFTKKDLTLHESPGSTFGNYLTFVGCVIGIILIWWS